MRKVYCDKCACSVLDPHTISLPVDPPTAPMTRWTWESYDFCNDCVAEVAVAIRGSMTDPNTANLLQQVYERNKREQEAGVTGQCALAISPPTPAASVCRPGDGISEGWDKNLKATIDEAVKFVDEKELGIPLRLIQLVHAIKTAMKEVQ